MDFARISIQKPVLTWLLVIGSLIGGYFGYLKVGRLEDPAFTIKEAVVITPYPGATAEQVELEVTDRLEAAIQRLESVKELRSKSYAGSSVIEVELMGTSGPDVIPQIWDELRRKVGDIQPYLPDGVMPSMVNDDFGDVYGILYTLYSDEVSPADLHAYAKRLRLQLLQVKDVADVQISGDIGEEFHVEFSPEQLASFGLHPGELLNGLVEQNKVTPAGGYSVGGRFAQIHPSGLFEGVEDLADLPIGRQGNDAFLRLGDVAGVTRGYEERPSQFIRFNGKNAILIGVSGRPNTNIVDVGKRVDARLLELDSERPLGVQMDSIYEQHTIVDNAVNGFVFNLALSVVIVVGVLCLFMGWRSGLVVGGVLFLTVAATVFFMFVLGIEMERISLGALIIAMGMLVDNAIVVAEGMLVRVQAGQDKLKAASEAVMSTWLPLLGATVVGVLAFSGIGLSSDATGEFTFSLFVVVSISLLLSWVFAVTVTPLFGHYILKRGDDSEADIDPYRGFLYSSYRWALKLSLRFRFTTIVILVALTMTSLFAFQFVKQSFFPDSNTPVFYVNAWTPFGTDIRTTSEMARKLEAAILKDERVESVASLVGAGAPRFMLVYSPEQPDSSYMQLIVRTYDDQVIDDLIQEILEGVRVELPELFVKTERVRLGPGVSAKIEARLIGEDPAELRRLGEKVKTLMYQDPILQDIRSSWREPVPVLRPQFDVERGMQQGVTRKDFAQQLQMLSEGAVFGVFRDADELIPIRVRLPEAERESSDDLGQRLVWSPGRNSWVPVDSFTTDITFTSEEGIIRRMDRERVLTIEANPIAGKLASEAQAGIRPVIENLELPRGYRLEWGGEWESSTEAQTALFKGLPLGYLGMLIIVILLFGKVRQPIVVWSVVPMSVIGISYGLLFSGVAFGFMALLGAISLTGMLLKNSIVLVDEIDARIASGKPRYDALVEASVSRMRPVALASVTTILGMLPLIFDAFFIGMAVTIMAGLAFATLLTLIAVPVVYKILFRIRMDETAESKTALAANK